MTTETEYKMTTEEHKAAAAVILQQLGGRQFIAMVGAKHLSVDDRLNTPNMGCEIKAGTKVTHMTIVLDPDDTYTMKLIRIRGSKLTVVDETSGLYCDMLQDHFTEITGLNTTLGTLGR